MNRKFSNENTYKIKHRDLILSSCLLCMFMVEVEATIVSTAMPIISKSLGGFSLFGWVFSVYLLAQAITIPIYGRLADLYGCRIVLFVGTTIFLIGSFLCGIANSLIWLIIFRSFQGLGAGSITPIITTLTYHLYDKKDRAKIQGYLSSVWGCAAVTGPLIGAYIISYFHWAIIFWINVPIGILSLSILMIFIPNDNKGEKHKIDFIGIFLFCLFIGSIMLLLMPYRYPNYTTYTLIFCASLSIIFLIYCECVVSDPMFPIELWKNKIILLSNFGGLIISAGMMAISAFLPIYIQIIFNGSTFQAGVSLSMMSIGWPLASICSGKLLRVSSSRTLILVGSLFLITGNFVLALLMPSEGIYMSRIGSFLVGLGMGFINTMLIISIQNSVNKDIQGVATASLLFSRMLGSAIGTALFSAILNKTLTHKLPDINDAIQMLMDERIHRTLKQFQFSALRHIIAQSLNLIFISAIAFSLIIFFIGLFFQQKK